MADEPKGRDTDWHTGRRGPPDESTPRDLAPADAPKVSRDADDWNYEGIYRAQLKRIGDAEHQRQAELASLREENANLVAANHITHDELSASTAECARLRGLLLLIITAYHIDSPAWVTEVRRAILRAIQELNPAPSPAALTPVTTDPAQGGERGAKP